MSRAALPGEVAGGGVALNGTCTADLPLPVQCPTGGHLRWGGQRLKRERPLCPVAGGVPDLLPPRAWRRVAASATEGIRQP